MPFFIFISFTVILTMVFGVSEALSLTQKRPFTVKDSFTRTDLVELNHGGIWLNPFLPSSDGKKIFMVTSKGNVDALTYDFKLLMFSTDDIVLALQSEKKPLPRPTILMETKFNQQTSDGSDFFSDHRGIKRLHQTKNPDELLFIASDKNGLHQIFRVNVATLRLEQITTMPQHIIDFIVLDKRNEVLFTVSDKNRRDDHCRKRHYSIMKIPLSSAICFGSGESFAEKKANDKHFSPPFGPVKLYKAGLQINSTPVMLADNIWMDYELRPHAMAGGSTLLTLLPSPGQTKALLRTFANSPPEELKELYQKTALYKLTQPDDREADYSHVTNPLEYYSFYTLIDFENNAVKSYRDLPIPSIIHDNVAEWPPPIWLNESTVFVPELFPLTNSSPIGAAKSHLLSDRRGTLIDLANDQYLFKGDSNSPIVDATFNKNIKKVSKSSAIHRVGDWARSCIAQPLENRSSPAIGCYIDNNKLGLRLFTGEDARTLPNIYATDLHTGNTRRIMELNPQFDEVTFADLRTFVIADEMAGRVGIATFLPPKYNPKKRYPVVVVSGILSNEKFVFDGPLILTTPDATQALANNDIIVMYVFEPKPLDKSKRSWKYDGRPGFARAVNAGLRFLNERGMVDLSKIGITGFSTYGRFVMDMALHPDYPIEALLISDAMSMSPFAYTFYFNGFPAQLKALDAMHCGARPWGERRDEWLRRNPYFNLDKLNSAALITANSGLSVNWADIIYGLQWLRKPVDSYNFRDNQHPTLEAYSRYHQAQLTVDWFNFWLNGVESPSPEKIEQYNKWRKLRELKRSLPPARKSPLPLSKMDCQGEEGNQL